MDLLDFISDPVWDAPFFKVLASNDTGAAEGHQAGVAIPRELRRFLPRLEEAQTTAAHPTADRNLEALLYEGEEFRETVTTRYQYQTWGGTRAAESRITGQLGPIHNVAEAHDVMVFQRRCDSLSVFRIILVRQHTDEFAAIEPLLGAKRWGTFADWATPVSQEDVIAADHHIAALAESPFSLLDPNPNLVSTTVTRVARSIVFRERVVSAYEQACAITGVSLVSSNFLHEVDAAHIVPRGRAGSDDPRNGVALSKTVHWAFDRGLFHVDENYRVQLSQFAISHERNALLHEFAGRQINLPDSERSRPSLEAFAWHRENVFS